MIPWE